MASDPSLNPYRTPPTEVADAPPGRRPRPGWFVTICVIAIALGATGFMHALYGFAEIAVGDRLQAAYMPKAPEAAEDLQQIQKDLTEGIKSVQIRYLVPSLVLDCARLVISICLVVCGVMCLVLKPAGRKLLIVTFAVTLGFELCDAILQALMARDLIQPVTAFGQAIDQTRNSPAGAPSFGVTFMVGLLWFGMCVYYGLQVAKGAYYLGGFLYLRRSSLDPLFVPSERTAP